MPRTMKPALLALLASWPLLSNNALSEELIGVSPMGRVPLVELYTSEGCSSCPPADSWFSQLSSQPGLWTDFVPVAFHVDYWNYLGWPDRLADPRFSARQRLHARVGRVGTVYTPGFVKGGSEWRPPSSWQPDAISAAPASGVLRLRIAGDTVELDFESAIDHADALRVHLALLGSGIETTVESGENAGRTLRHDFAVLALTSQPLSRDGKLWSTRLSLPASGIDAPRYALAAWITGRDGLDALQAAGGWLARPLGSSKVAESSP